MTHELSNSYTTKSVAIRRAVEPHREWIEARLGVRLPDAVIVETAYGFHNAAIRRLLGYIDPCAPVPMFRSRLAAFIESAEIPDSLVPILEVTKHRAVSRSGEVLSPLSEESSAFEIEWTEGPIALRLKDVGVPVVALPVHYHPGPDSHMESQQDLIILPRQGIESAIALLKRLTLADERATLKVGMAEPQVVSRCDWDQLTLDPSIVSLLKSDFEMFFEREAWFRKLGLPFRRGYLLHGPPGNGKSSAIRAMLSSRGLCGFTIRFFDQHVGDEDLERLFSRAAQNAPSMVILEDIDRSFPRTGESKTQVSLQQLLNCLDGIGSSDGVITCATANEPSVLDPAILKRPGRFDRVVLFPNPTADLRLKYLSRIDSAFTRETLDAVVAGTDGMSFAQLREVHIMAAQAAFLEGREIAVDDLLDSVCKLRRTVLFGSLKTHSTGFARPAAVGRSKHERR